MKTPTPPPVELSSVSADLVEYSPRTAQTITYSICILLVAGMVWSNLAKVLEVAAAGGTVMPEHHVQVVQSLEGGVVDKILAHNGQHVEAGDTLVSLDPTPMGASRDELAEQLAGFTAAKIRLNALLADTSPDFPADLRASHPTLVAQSVAQFEASKAELANGLSSIDQQIMQRQLDLAENQSHLATLVGAQKLAAADLASLKQLLAEGAAGRAEVNAAKAHYNEIYGQNQQLRVVSQRLEAAVVELRSTHAEKISAFNSRTSDALLETEVKLSAVKSSLVAQQRRLDQTLIKSPSTGIIKILKPTSLGQVIKPGEEVAEIVPDNGELMLQARVKPEDIAFLREDMPALVKFTAYDYSIFGAVSGKVQRIAADSTVDEKGQTYYIVDVALASNHINRRGEIWPIKSGMLANVEIITGEKSVAQYITKPMHRMANAALRER